MVAKSSSDYKELVDGTKYPNPCPTLPTPPKTPLPTSPVLPKRGMGRVWIIYGSDCVTTRRYSGNRSLIGRNSVTPLYSYRLTQYDSIICIRLDADFDQVRGNICLELGGNSGITVIVTDNGRRVESESWNVAATDQITQGAVGDSNIEQGEDVGLIEIASQLWTDAVRQNSLRDDTSSKTCVLLGLVQFASVDGFVYRKIFSTSEILQLISCLF
ncbi:hypothetical protein FGSG_06485 [Fusarium graminearum PH-1]|uniref:Chromosome 4, complete genome n=1 Tax=Gibberella zeae (strain ATCC MYA-4620 / CBS 123657 / FGSC 9075 / NRRL 31084 / PH-1) TaxID=229533 RepID=I1RQY3_GIBZE|nr:hypothetical protein FGSG_06485 [Fusarium graminearum PH-1]ESU12583.1 hypothetical protein FGSG_06485 [Fusarium graminearum PH-1]CEF85539.1 unnamed protein product [Fusarium graminearum]|eukprot:XP_011326090.1 hypothetical protein FGSG_06485 [Fusarium graminearum PH-1]